MTRDEWEAIALLIENCWRGEFDETTSSAYFTMLSRFSTGEVMAALHKIVEDGKPFVPSVPEIVGAIRKMTEPQLPAWTDVWATLEVALRCNSEDEAVAYATESCHLVAGAFLRAEGFDRLRKEPFFDPDYGALRIRELHNRWVEFSGRSQERLRAGHAIEAGSRTSNGLNRLSVTELISVESGEIAESEQC